MKIKLIIICFFFPMYLNGQDSTSLVNDTAEKKARSFLPHHMKVQFAGGIGFLAIGAGYTHLKKKVDTDLYFGYVPEKIGGDEIFSLALKSTYSPWTLGKPKRYTFYPFSTGAFINYTFGSQFWIIEPDRYPDSYYGFPTSLRIGIFVGGRVRYQLKNKKVKGVGLYYEVGTNDLELISYIQNPEYLSPLKIINLSFGIKADF